MNIKEAARLLNVSEGVDAPSINAAYETQYSQLCTRIVGASTDALRGKYQAQLDELDTARDLLLTGDIGKTPAGFSQIMMDGLSQPPLSYTPPPEGEAPGQGLVIESGTLLAGRYEIKERIGAGGIGAVFRAFDRTRGNDIAIKVLLPSLLQNEKAKAHFLNEARLSADLSHPNIVNVYDVVEDGGLTFLTMELLEGQSLREYIQLYTRGMEVSETLRIVGAVAEALAYAHTETVHRDVKPENVFLCEGGVVKLMDFGIAHAQSTTQMTRTGAAMGTAYYIAPEQIKAAGTVDGRADEYALGVMLYEMLTGEIPQGRLEEPHKLNGAVSKKLSKAVMTALEVSREKRYPDMESFAKAIAGKGGAVPSSGAGNAALLPKVAAGIALVLIIGALATYMVGSQEMLGDVFTGLVPDAETEAAAISLQGEVKRLQKHLENESRGLDQPVRDAKGEVRRMESLVRMARDENEESRMREELTAAQRALALAEQVLEFSEEVIFSPESQTILEGQITLADAKVLDKRYGEARDILVDVKQTLALQLEQVRSVRPMLQSRAVVKEVRSEWQRAARQVITDNTEQGKSLEAGYEAANNLMNQGEFAEAETEYASLVDGYKNGIDDMAFEAARSGNTEADLQGYLQSYGAGRNAQAAQGQLDELVQARVASEQRDQQAAEEERIRLAEIEAQRKREVTARTSSRNESATQYSDLKESYDWFWENYIKDRDEMDDLRDKEQVLWRRSGAGRYIGLGLNKHNIAPEQRKKMANGEYEKCNGAEAAQCKKEYNEFMEIYNEHGEILNAFMLIGLETTRVAKEINESCGKITNAALKSRAQQVCDQVRGYLQ